MGRRKQRLFEARFKEEAVRRMLNGESIMRLSRELDVARAVLYRWRDTYRAEGLAGLERRRGRPRPGQQVVSLKSRDPAAERIAELDAEGRKAVLVSHQVNITALTGVYPGSGEIVVIRLGEDGEVSVEGRIGTD